MLQTNSTVCSKQSALWASSNAQGVACCKCTCKAMAAFCKLFFSWNWSCHCHCHGVKVVTPLLLLQWKTGAKMAFKCTPSWLCISSQTQCFGNFSFKEKMWRIHISWLSLDKKHATSPASNPVALATRTTSPLLQVDPDLSLAWWAIFKPWHASSKSGQMAFPNAKNFLGAGFGFNKAMVLSKASGLLAMVRSLASMSSKTDFSKTWVFRTMVAILPTHLFFLSMQKQFGRMPCLAKLLAMCNSQWCFLNMCQPHAFHLAKMDSTQIWISSGVTCWCQVACISSTRWLRDLKHCISVESGARVVR